MNPQELRLVTRNKRSLGYDDVHLLSNKPQKVYSRNDISRNYILERLMVAPMSAISSERFIKEANRLGLTVPIHRFCNPEQQAQLLSLQERKILCVGLNDWKERILQCARQELEIDQVLIDVANGFSYAVKETANQIYKAFHLFSYVGNVHTEAGVAFLTTEPGVIGIRIGIGPGAACTSTMKTGVGRGQLTAILDRPGDYSENGVWLIADGGIRKPGDVAKAFGAGADVVMIGSMFAEAIEAECDVYFGGASALQKQLTGQDVRHIEGKEVIIDPGKKRPLEAILNEIVEGVQSAVSYSGYDSIEDFIGNGEFEVV